MTGPPAGTGGRYRRLVQGLQHLGGDGIHRTHALDAAALRRALGGAQLLVEIHQRLGLGMIEVQTLANGGFAVVFALYQRLAGQVVGVGAFGGLCST